MCEIILGGILKFMVIVDFIWFDIKKFFDMSGDEVLIFVFFLLLKLYDFGVGFVSDGIWGLKILSFKIVVKFVNG